MTNDGKENIRHVTCTNHATRSDRDFIRACPSKLSKRELEDLYFSLLENNTQMKKTINGQRDQIKLLTTKVNRMTVQKNALGNLNKDCCAGTKAIINEQKESIAELKTANERLSDRIRLLNMRLCSAKQFLRRSSAQSTTRCTKCNLTPNQSVKNSSMSALNARASDANLRSQTEAAGSCQFLNKESSTIKPDIMQTSQSEMKDEPCQQNKCRTVIDELKQKIENLEQELSKTHEQYCERMRKLEEQMLELRGENSRVRVLQAESDHRLEVEQKKAGEMLHKLRDTEMQRDNLATELQIEKSKVSELETQVKAADITSQVAEALEKHLKNNTIHRTTSTMQNKTKPASVELCASEWNYSSTILVPNNSEISKIEESDKERIVTKSSDDSGYAEKFDDKKDISKTDQDILEKIASLQAQLNNLKHYMNENDKRDDLKSKLVEPLQESKLESNETYAAMDANSSLSNDIFQTSKIKDINQCASTSQAPEILISIEEIEKNPKTGADKSLDNFDPHSKLQMLSPLPVDVPRMPYFGESSKNPNILSNPKQNDNNINNTSFEKHLSENRTTIREGDENERSYNININDYEDKPSYLNKEEIVDKNDYYKKRRRSSLKNPNQDRVKDLSVSYDQNKIILGSALNIVDKVEERQGNGNGKVIRGQCQSDSEPNMESKANERNLKKKICYEKENFHTAPSNETYLDERVSEKECDLDSKKIEKEYSGIPYTKENLDNLSRGMQSFQDIDPISKNVESPVGTSSGNSTYTVESKPAQGKSNKDATYQIESNNEDAACQAQTGNNHLEVCQGYARICTCPRIPHRDISLFRTCSGTSRFQTTPSTKNKFRQCPCMRDSKTDISGIAGSKANHLKAKQSQMPQPLNSSTPNQQKTYDVKGSAEVIRSTSPDSTDHEISSLTDLPNEEKSPRDYISPGEEKATSTFSDSYAAATTTDYGSLSLGEVPITGVCRRLLTKWRKHCKL